MVRGNFSSSYYQLLIIKRVIMKANLNYHEIINN